MYDYDDKKAWYAVHTYSGYENKVKTSLEKRIETMGMEDTIFRIMVPMQETTEIKNGVRTTSEKKVFPGYVLVEMILTDESWYIVRNTTGVTGFVGTGKKAVPLHDYEVAEILKEVGEAPPKAELKVDVGDDVRILDPAFEGLVGKISEIDREKEKLTVMVAMFGGRETPVDLDYDQVIPL